MLDIDLICPRNGFLSTKLLACLRSCPASTFDSSFDIPWLSTLLVPDIFEGVRSDESVAAMVRILASNDFYSYLPCSSRVLDLDILDCRHQAMIALSGIESALRTQSYDHVFDTLFHEVFACFQ